MHESTMMQVQWCKYEYIWIFPVSTHFAGDINIYALTYPSMFKNCLRVMRCSSTRAQGRDQNQAWKNLCWAWINAQGKLQGLMLSSKMNAGLDTGPARLCEVALSRICSSIPFDWQNKKKTFLSHKILQNKTSEFKKMGERATFLTQAWYFGAWLRT